MPDAGAPTIAHGPAPPGLAALFGGFLGIGMLGFGGVLPWARRMMVDQRGWLSPDEFNDLLAFCQFLPGPNIVNMAVALGDRCRGPIGSVAAVTGLLAAPMAIVVLIGGVFDRYVHLPVVAHGFAGLAAAASGMVVAMAAKIATPLRKDGWAIAVATAAFLAIAILRWPLLPTMLTLAPVSILVGWRLRR